MSQGAFWESQSSLQLQEMYREFGATGETIQRDVATLRQWLAMQPHIPPLDVVPNLDQWLRMYLLRCKNSLQRTKESVEALLSARSTMPEFFQGRDPTSINVQGSFDTTLIATMPQLTSEGYRVHYYAYPSTDAKGFSVEALFRRVLMMAELLMRDDLPRGDIIVVDLSNGSASRLRDFTLAMSLFSKFVRVGLKMYPVRMKQFYLINLPPFLSSVMNMLGQVMREKLYSRVVVDPSGAEVLKKNLPPKCIPQDYGGEGPTLSESNALWRHYLSANREYFLAQENIKTDESKRIGPPCFVDDMGSFRTLAVD